MKTFNTGIRFANFITSIFIIIVISSTAYPEQQNNEYNLLTFSKIDQASKMASGKNVKVAVLDWQFDLSGPEAEKYIDPVSMLPDEDIGQLKPWHGEWMAEIIHTIAPDAKIIPIKARGLNSKNYEDYLIKGIYYAADHGAIAVTSSMGPLKQSARLDSAVAYAEKHGMIFINVHPETIVVEGEKPRMCKAV